MTLQLRRAGIDDVETLVAIQQESAVAAFANVFPPERYPFPTDAIRDGWAKAVAESDTSLTSAPCETLKIRERDSVLSRQRPVPRNPAQAQRP